MYYRPAASAISSRSTVRAVDFRSKAVRLFEEHVVYVDSLRWREIAIQCCDVAEAKQLQYRGYREVPHFEVSS